MKRKRDYCGDEGNLRKRRKKTATVETIVKTAREYIEKFNYYKAAQEFSKAIRIDSKNPELYAERAYMYFGQGDFVNTTKDMDMAIKLDPKKPLYYIERGRMIAKNDIDSAILDFSAAIRLDPENPKYYIERGNLYKKMEENFQNCLNDYSSAIFVTKCSVPKYFELRARLYANQGDYHSSIVDYTSAIKLNPENLVHYYQKRGECFEKFKKFDYAIEDYTRCIKLDLNFFYFFLRAKAYFLNNQFEKAIEDFLISIHLESGSSNTESFTFNIMDTTRTSIYSRNKFKISCYFNIGCCYYRMNNCSKGLAYCNKAGVDLSRVFTNNEDFSHIITDEKFSICEDRNALVRNLYHRIIDPLLESDGIVGILFHDDHSFIETLYDNDLITYVQQNNLPTFFRIFF